MASWSLKLQADAPPEALQLPREAKAGAESPAGRWGNEHSRGTSISGVAQVEGTHKRTRRILTLRDPLPVKFSMTTRARRAWSPCSLGGPNWFAVRLQAGERLGSLPSGARGRGSRFAALSSSSPRPPTGVGGPTAEAPADGRAVRPSACPLDAAALALGRSCSLPLSPRGEHGSRQQGALQLPLQRSARRWQSRWRFGEHFL